MAAKWSFYSPPVEELMLSDDETVETAESVQIFDISTAKQWFQLIEDGVPEDVALKLLEEEAKATDAPSEYKGCLKESGNHYNFLGLTKAESKVIGMYCTEGYQFYFRLNADCRNRIWKKYRIYTSLLHSVCMKLRNMPFERREQGDELRNMLMSYFETQEPGGILYRGLKCNLPRSADTDFCWPCFTSATTEKSIAEGFGRSLIRLKSATGAPVKEFSSFFEYEILFSPFYVFKSRISGSSQIYCSMPEQTGFFISFPYYRGALLGAVVGNCLGSPFEFDETSTLETLLTFFSKLGISSRGAYRYTCDISMTQALANSLIKRNTLNIKDLGNSFVKEYFSDPDRNYGQSIVAVLTEQKRQKWNENLFSPARKQFDGTGSHGNGGAMRIAPAALFFYKLNERIFKLLVRKITRLTHSNIVGVNGAILQACAVKLALKFALDGAWQKDIRTEFLEDLIKIMRQVEGTGHGHKPYCEKLTTMKKYLSISPSLATVKKELGNGMPALEAVPAAIYSFVRGLQPIGLLEIPSTYNGFERTIIFAISLGGDTDTIASMAGAIAGAYYGQDSIPQRWRDACEAKGISEAKRYSKEIHNLVWQ